jgi:hypothetical protein
MARVTANEKNAGEAQYKILAVIKKVRVEDATIRTVTSQDGTGTYKAVEIIDEQGAVSTVPVIGEQVPRKGAYYLTRKQADIEGAKSFLTLDYVTSELTDLYQQKMGKEYKQMIANGIPEAVAMKQVFGI